MTLPGGETVAVSVGIGIAMGLAEVDVDNVIRDADLAVYRAKELGRARHEMFDEQLDARPRPSRR